MFAANTMVTLENGSEVPIGLIQPGEWVKDASLNPVKVLHVTECEPEEKLLVYFQGVGTPVIECGAEQQVLVKRGSIVANRLSWKDSTQIYVNSKLVRAPLGGIGISLHNGTMYKVTTSGSNTYLANRITVQGS